MLNAKEILDRINIEQENETNTQNLTINAEKLEVVNELIKCITQIEMGNKGAFVKCEYDSTGDNKDSLNWNAYITVPPTFIISKNGLMMESENNAWRTLFAKADNIIMFTGETTNGNIRLTFSIMGLWEA